MAGGGHFACTAAAEAHHRTGEGTSDCTGLEQSGKENEKRLFPGRAEDGEAGGPRVQQHSHMPITYLLPSLFLLPSHTSDVHLLNPRCPMKVVEAFHWNKCTKVHKPFQLLSSKDAAYAPFIKMHQHERGNLGGIGVLV